MRVNTRYAFHVGETLLNLSQVTIENGAPQALHELGHLSHARVLHLGPDARA